MVTKETIKSLAISFFVLAQILTGIIPAATILLIIGMCLGI